MDSKFFKGFIAGLAGALLMGTVVFAVHSAGYLGQNQEEYGVQSEDGQEDANDQEIAIKIKLLEQYIDKFYLNKIEEKDFADGIYKGLVSSLGDPYSVYYTKKEYASLMEASSGVYCGIGATVSQDVNTGMVTIVKPFVNGPAYEEGILPGDIIYKVDGKEVTGLDLTEVVSRMKGEEGTKVSITIVREGTGEPIEYTVSRKKIEVPTISSEMMEDKVGYIAISEFDEVTAPQFKKAIEDLEKQGMEGLVIDLRNNGGGLLGAVVEMLDRMLPKGLIVYTKDKNGVGDKYSSSNREKFSKPLAVLINGNSASASEVFAGAIQDYKMGTLVGTTSFGKGIVQSVIPLQDGTAIKLTTSKYYTPLGRNIHGTGIEPDVKVELDEALKTKVVISKEEDNQLKKAVEVIKKKMK